MEDLADLAHGLRVGGAGREVAAEVQPPEQPAPTVVPLRRVGQAPRHQRLALQQDGQVCECPLRTAAAHGHQRLQQSIQAMTAACHMLQAHRNQCLVLQRLTQALTARCWLRWPMRTSSACIDVPVCHASQAPYLTSMSSRRMGSNQREHVRHGFSLGGLCERHGAHDFAQF